jgi:hypothetical protein
MAVGISSYGPAAFRYQRPAALGRELDIMRIQAIKTHQITTIDQNLLAILVLFLAGEISP